jgi:NAD(P)H-hydrate repair Nnr-like enzyme with NAD(P)H-hydrate dehydratase domain
VLAGIVAARLAGTGDPYRAACEGAWLHAEAGRLAGPAFLASDIALHVPAAIASCL